ncbi:hypothetical protein HDV00_000582 [Rhizophlyctis rosea]|nr:hypothetical protein HDV00_000582 [Rhizophlyctis rosea]
MPETDNLQAASATYEHLQKTQVDPTSKPANSDPSVTPLCALPNELIFKIVSHLQKRDYLLFRATARFVAVLLNDKTTFRLHLPLYTKLYHAIVPDNEKTLSVQVQERGHAFAKALIKLEGVAGKGWWEPVEKLLKERGDNSVAFWIEEATKGRDTRVLLWIMESLRECLLLNIDKLPLIELYTWSAIAVHAGWIESVNLITTELEHVMGSLEDEDYDKKYSDFAKVLPKYFSEAISLAAANKDYPIVDLLCKYIRRVTYHDACHFPTFWFVDYLEAQLLKTASEDSEPYEIIRRSAFVIWKKTVAGIVTRAFSKISLKRGASQSFKRSTRFQLTPHQRKANHLDLLRTVVEEKPSYIELIRLLCPWLTKHAKRASFLKVLEGVMEKYERCMIISVESEETRLHRELFETFVQASHVSFDDIFDKWYRKTHPKTPSPFYGTTPACASLKIILQTHPHALHDRNLLLRSLENPFKCQCMLQAGSDFAMTLVRIKYYRGYPERGGKGWGDKGLGYWLDEAIRAQNVEMLQWSLRIMKAHPPSPPSREREEATIRFLQSRTLLAIEQGWIDGVAMLTDAAEYAFKALRNFPDLLTTFFSTTLSCATSLKQYEILDFLFDTVNQQDNFYERTDCFANCLKEAFSSFYTTSNFPALSHFLTIAGNCGVLHSIWHKGDTDVILPHVFANLHPGPIPLSIL